MSLATYLLVVQASAATRRASRQRRRDLERELAGYATPAQRCDLEAMLDRYPDGVTYEIREILSRQALTQEAKRFPAIGRT
jgi:hypothetical protein